MNILSRCAGEVAAQVEGMHDLADDTHGGPRIIEAVLRPGEVDSCDPQIAAMCLREDVVDCRRITFDTVHRKSIAAPPRLRPTIRNGILRRNERILREDESVDVLKNIEDIEMLIVIGGVNDDIGTLEHQTNPCRAIGQRGSVRT
ncbi:MAG: hypothetical protein ACFNZX_08825 [Actinomyces sp.]